MSIWKKIGLALLVIVCVAIMILCFSPLFALMDMLLGIRPVIICGALLLIGLALAFAIDNPILKKLMGFLIGACILAVILYFTCEAIFGVLVPTGVIIGVSAIIGFAAFLTSIAKNIPFFGAKLIPPIWIFAVFGAFALFIFGIYA